MCVNSVKQLSNCCLTIFSLTTTNETLEEKLEDLRKQIEDLNREVEIERRKNERLQLEQRTKIEESTIVLAPSSTSSRKPDVSFELQCNLSRSQIIRVFNGIGGIIVNNKTLYAFSVEPKHEHRITR